VCNIVIIGMSQRPVTVKKGRSGDKKVWTGIVLIVIGVISVGMLLGLHVVPLNGTGVSVLMAIVNGTTVTGAMILQSGLIQGDQHVTIRHSPEYKLVKCEVTLQEE